MVLIVIVTAYGCEKRTIINTQLERVYSVASPQFKDVCFINENVGIIVGSNSFSIRTEDGGKTWTSFQVDAFTNNDYSDVAFIDSVFIIKYWNYYAYSIDLGKTWESSDTNSFKPIRIKFTKKYYRNENTYFLDSLQGLEYRISDVRLYGYVKHTADNGKTWQSIYTGQNNQVKNIDFFDSNLGFAVGNNSFLRTFNGGLSWSYYRDQNGESFPTDVFNLSATSKDFVFIISPTELFKVRLN